MTWTPIQIRQLRRRLSLSERQLARILGYSREDTVVALEKGAYKPPADLCQALDHLKARAERTGR